MLRLLLAGTLYAGTTPAAAPEPVRVGWAPAPDDAAGIPDGVRFGVEEVSRTAALLARGFDLVAAADAPIVLSRRPGPDGTGRGRVQLDVSGDPCAAGSALSVAPAERACLEAVVAHLVRGERARRPWLLYADGATGVRHATLAREVLGARRVVGEATPAAPGAIAGLVARITASRADVVVALTAGPLLGELVQQLPDGVTVALPFPAAEAPARPSLIRAVLWHHTLARAGAEQLNDRFRRRWGRPMTSPDWAGWFGTKLAWETLVRGTGETPRLHDALSSGTLRFDGHKGRALAFARDGRLRQPLYVVGMRDGAEAVLEST